MCISKQGEEQSSISIMGVCREEGGIAMNRLTQKDGQGNWSLRGVPWEHLYEGKIITKELWKTPVWSTLEADGV